MIKTVEEGLENFKNAIKNITWWYGPFFSKITLGQMSGPLSIGIQVLGLTQEEFKKILAECGYADTPDTEKGKER